MLAEPLVYISSHLKQHQAEYYRRLSEVRKEGDWEGWVGFFLDGVEAAALAAERGIVAMASLLNADRRRLLSAPRVGAVALRLFELMPLMPRFTIEQVRQKLETTFPTATAAVKLMEALGIVTELTEQKKNRCFSYAARSRRYSPAPSTTACLRVAPLRQTVRVTVSPGLRCSSRLSMSSRSATG